MKIKYWFVFFLVIIPGCGSAEQDLIAPNNKFILLERNAETGDNFDYAGVKIIHQGLDQKDELIYEWITMYEGELIPQFESQNFKFGEHTGIGEFGIGFEGYRLNWQPSNEKGFSIISTMLQSVGIVKYCLSTHSEIWGLDLAQEINRLDNEARCRK